MFSGTRWDKHQKIEAECSLAAKFILFIKREECAVYVAAKLVFFNEWKTVASGLGRAASCVELV